MMGEQYAAVRCTEGGCLVFLFSALSHMKTEELAISAMEEDVMLRVSFFRARTRPTLAVLSDAVTLKRRRFSFYDRESPLFFSEAPMSPQSTKRK